jgi:mRNA interferase MazF
MTIMTSYQGGDLILVTQFPYTTGQRGKPRPALVVFDSGDADLVAAKVTSQLRQSSFDVNLLEWRAAGLLLPSFVRLHKLETVAKVLVSKRIGQLQPADRQAVAAVLRQMFANW